MNANPVPDKTSPELRQFSTRIERELLKEVRREAVEKEITVQEIVNSAVRFWLHHQKEA